MLSFLANDFWCGNNLFECLPSSDDINLNCNLEEPSTRGVKGGQDLGNCQEALTRTRGEAVRWYGGGWLWLPFKRLLVLGIQ